LEGASVAFCLFHPSTWRKRAVSIITEDKRRSRSKQGKHKAGGLPGEVEAALARERTPESKPVCPPSLSEYIEYAKELFRVPEWTERTLTGEEYTETVTRAVKDFGIAEEDIESISESHNEIGAEGPYGFIVTTDNSYTNNYGYGHLYHELKGPVNYKRIDTIKNLKGGRKRLYIYDLGLLDERDVYQWFADLVNRQNNTGAALISPEGKQVLSQNGRFCNKRGKRSIQIQKAFKEGIGEVLDCILLTLTTHEEEVLQFMPENTNLLPVQFATITIGSWVSKFINSLRQFQRVRGIPWEFVGWVIEFQKNGYPHIHMIFRGKWIGDVREIAKLWPYCEPQGVDYMNKAKYEKKLRSEGKLKPGHHTSNIRLINYITSYVSKCGKAVIIKEEDKRKTVNVHKGYAWLAFIGGRMFNIAREYKKEKQAKEKKEGWKYKGLEIIIKA
jgi:hypothetical protein